MNISIPIYSFKEGKTESLTFSEFSPAIKRQKKLSYEFYEEIFFFVKLNGSWYPLSKGQNDELDRELKKNYSKMIPCKALLEIGKSICDDQVLEIKSQWTDKEKLILEHHHPWQYLF